MVDESLPLPGGRVVRFRMRKIPTREQAMALVTEEASGDVRGPVFDRPKASKLTVRGGVAHPCRAC